MFLAGHGPSGTRKLCVSMKKALTSPVGTCLHLLSSGQVEGTRGHWTQCQHSQGKARPYQPLAPQGQMPGVSTGWPGLQWFRREPSGAPGAKPMATTLPHQVEAASPPEARPDSHCP